MDPSMATPQASPHLLILCRTSNLASFLCNSGQPKSQSIWGWRQRCICSLIWPKNEHFLSNRWIYAKWYEQAFRTPINWSHVLPIKRALQGHEESRQLWEIHINKILQSPELLFKTTTHNRKIYTATFEGERVFLLCQVNNFALACTNGR